MKKKHFNIPIFIPELACPFRCIYCNQCTVSGVRHLPDDKTILHTIDAYLGTIPTKSDIQLAYFGGNFTGLSLEAQQHYLNLVLPYIRSGRIRSIRISTRPDYITDEILLMLKNHGVESIELGAQSMDDSVLQASARGHSSSDTAAAAEQIRTHGFSLGLQMMIGLPGDSFESSVYTVGRIIELGAQDTRIYPTLVIRNTVLEGMYLNKEYVPLEIAEAVRWSREALLSFERSGVNVLKVGLHPSEGLLSGEELVAGPFHPSFRELVETSIWEELLAPLCIEQGAKAIVRVGLKQLNAAIGYQAANRKMLLNHFKEVKFEGSEDLSGRDFEFKIKKG